MVGRRRVSVILRFTEYELEEFDNLVHTSGLPRSSLVNIALEEFLHSAGQRELIKCKKRRVNLALWRNNVKKLNEYARTYRVLRPDMIRRALRDFELKH